MSWKPIVAGVDLSAEGIRAAVTAAKLAQTAGTDCYLVHAVRDPWTEAALAQIPMDVRQLNRIVLDSARAQLLKALTGKVPEAMFQRMDTRFGPAAAVLDEAVEELDAELVVLGGKHHSALGRWIGGSTAHHMVRRTDVPILVNGPGDGRIRRVLAAVDVSSAARPTLYAAERLARLFGSDLRALHVVEPAPLLPELPIGLNDEDVVRRAEEELERSVWPLIDSSAAERLVRRGPAAETIAGVARSWEADVVVVGSHGRGWVDRILIGSVTERLLNLLPSSLLVVPIAAPGYRSRTSRRKPTRTKPKKVKV
ncbi:MAG: universal stress protein [Gemmatimonadetes bacterium]|nr:universal stress protein [Gemmatimonadota bacterium]